MVKISASNEESKTKVKFPNSGLTGPVICNYFC